MSNEGKPMTADSDDTPLPDFSEPIKRKGVVVGTERLQPMTDDSTPRTDAIRLLAENFVTVCVAGGAYEGAHRDLMAAVESLERELAQREGPDTKRLDWLEKHPFTAYRNRDPEHGDMHHFTLVDEDRKPRQGIVNYTLRACIDAALAAHELPTVSPGG